MIWLLCLGSTVVVEVLLVAYSLKRDVRQKHGRVLPANISFANIHADVFVGNCLPVPMTSDQRFSDSGKNAACAIRLILPSTNQGNRMDFILSFGSFGGLVIIAANGTHRDHLLVYPGNISTKGGSILHVMNLWRDELLGFHSIAIRAVCGDGKCEKLREQIFRF